MKTSTEIEYASLKDLILVTDAVPILETHMIIWARVNLLGQTHSRLYFSLFSEGKINLLPASRVPPTQQNL